MDSEQFKEFGKAAVDYLADYYDNIRDRYAYLIKYQEDKNTFVIQKSVQSQIYSVLYIPNSRIQYI